MNPRPTSRAFLLVASIALIAVGEARQGGEPEPDGWLGIYYSAVDSLPVIELEAGGEAALYSATTGLVVDAVFPYSAAEEGGLIEGDIIIALSGEPFTCPKDSVRALFRGEIEGMVGDARPMRVIRNAVARRVRVDGEELEPLEAGSFWLDARAFSDSLESGGSLEATASRKQEVLDLDVVLGPRPEAKWPPAPASDELLSLAADFSNNAERESDFTPLVWKLIDEANIRDDCEDLFERLTALHRHSDPLRHEAVVVAHRFPFILETFVRWGHRIITPYFREPFEDRLEFKEPGKAVAGSELWSRLRSMNFSGPKVVSPGDHGKPQSDLYRPESYRQENLEPYLAWIETTLKEIASTHDSVFAGWTAEERDFVEEEMWGLSDSFTGEVYIHFDRDRKRYENNRKLIDLAGKTDYLMMKKLFKRTWRLMESPMSLEQYFKELFPDSLDKEYLVNRETPYGRIIVAGTGNNWHRDQDVAFLLDLGGDDFYTGNAGGSRGFKLPASVCFDLSGNDSYESTERGAQGSGILGTGILLDRTGNDTYIGKEWCQGTGFFGIGQLSDKFGDDTYRGRTFCQGVGLFGRGYLQEKRGNDRYEGDTKVQGVGLAGGIGAVLDHGGDDQYYAKGLHPTGYGTSGIFDSWSQGCGMGFRTLASGGLGMVIDGGGSDRMEAGNFSQGGGYYYGMGIVSAGGDEDDVYIGSRYNQGFSAHQAVGVFIEEGGDDFYTTRHGVAQGLAWDESVTLFMDKRGDDTYEGGRFFSQGASAHNSICFFVDMAGRDEYRYDPGPARSGANTYHGGTSLSLFIDEGGADDLYIGADFPNGATLHNPEHGFFLDLPGTIEEAISERIWKKVKSGE